MDKHDILKKYFGHSSFRQGQSEIIDHILSGQDCLSVMPTGAGKSMCYQIPAMLLSGITIVISPLISLMKDQVEALRQAGVPAAYINSSLSSAEYSTTLSMINSGECRILYIAPERLAAESFISLCSRIRIPLVAIDEAHCVSQWGQDFRPSYLKITEFVKRLATRPVLAAFTATATDVVKKDIETILELNNPFRITTGFDRANLYFEVRQTPDIQKNSVLLEILRQSEGCSAVVYCSTRKNTDKVYEFLSDNKVSTARYHAGLSDEERHKAQDDFIYDRVNVIVATNAFGMGIDKSDVSLVVHYNMPKDIESYYQEAGRAGRDGSPARCILLYSKADVRTANFLIDHGHEDSGLSETGLELIKERDRERLKKMTFYSTTKNCLREFILRYFGEHSADFCGNCSSCNKNFDTTDITVKAQKILSCIFRMKQKNIVPKKGLICETLKGVGTRDDCRTLSTFGIMSDSTLPEIAEITDYLCENEFIENNGNDFSLTTLADDFVKSRRTLLMKQPKKADSTVAKSKSSTPEQAENPQLFARLKELRKNLAVTQSVPAYVVFPDATLREMSAKLPLTDKEFMKISGVGEKKAARYGKKFIKEIQKFINEKQ